MGVLIEGMDMPKNCASCPCGNAQIDYCYAKNRCIVKLDNVYPYTEKRPDWCPLVEIPTPHGNLVDLDAMVDKFWDGDYMEIHCRDLDDIPVIVEAEADHDSD